MKINLDEFHSYRSLLSIWIQLHKNYPHLTTIFSIGQSHENRELICIKLGKGCIGPIMLSGVHGRERTSPIVLTKIIADYCMGYDGCNQKLQVLNHSCIYFIPLLNPDGYEIADFRYEYKENARGIDLNRNFCSENFTISPHSGTPFSENETKAFRNFCQSHHTTGLIDFHSRGESIYYYRNAMDTAYNQRQYAYAKQLACLSGYRLHAPEEENPGGSAGGNSVNYYSETFQKPTFTIETVKETESFPLAIRNQQITYQKIKEIPISFLFYRL